ncbi:MAG: sigma factor-like helix-turn-helix DNA-binding protein [Halanaerobiales bacterium]|jgi:RNA polymerase sigma factor (sigma-70 family)|nr:sigma factor-like helix-turn-helix DNA-binding protein [Halanaerobiales bacterium]
MQSTKLLRKIKDLKNKKAKLDRAGETDRELLIRLMIYKECKNSLNNKQKRILELYFESGYTQTEVADIIGKSASTVGNYVKAIREQFSYLIDNEQLPVTF